MWRYLDVRREGAVEYVTLNRPDVGNALNDEIGAELRSWAATARAAAAASDGDLRVVVLSGAGAVFCAGGRHRLDVARAALFREGEYPRRDRDGEDVRRAEHIAGAAERADGLTS